MNILASYNWIKEYLKTSATAEEFAREMSLKSMSVESVVDLSEKFERMVVGVVLAIKPHPKADRLRIVETDIGGQTVDIVCGGSNVIEGMKVLVALPGSRVRWHGEGDLIELKETEIRGVKSIGMICAPAEVGFEKLQAGEHEIWDLTDWTSAKAGTPIAKALELDDTIFDIEITTNRPDCMSIVGLACEAGAAVDGEFHLEPFKPILAPSTNVDLKVRVEDSVLCPRYMAVAIKGVTVAPSPAWLQKKLLLAGHRPINNIVDITNYVLHELGQPLHAFDYDTLSGGQIVVRRAKNGETMEALDGKTYELTTDNLVIADGEKPVAVGGVMGGQLTGTTGKTTTVVFEAAAFDPVSVRRTSRALNLQSDSQLVFEKGLSTQSPQFALARAVGLALEIAGGEIASEVIDARTEAYKPLVFPLHTERIRARLGVEISDKEMVKILTKLGFMVAPPGLPMAGEELRVEVPFWRDHDIEGEIDFTEEVARIYGYHNLPSVLPSSPPPADMGDQSLVWEDRLKNMLMGFGYTELYGYSFTSEADFERYGLDVSQAVKIYNPLSADLTHMRTSLMPGLLRDIEQNQGYRPCGQVFDLSRVYLPRKNDLPLESTSLVVAQFGVENVEHAFLELKGVLETIAQRCGVLLEVGREGSVGPQWHPTRTASIYHQGKIVGTIGQVADSVAQNFKIDRPVVALELDLQSVVGEMHVVQRYTPIPLFPSIERDLSVAVADRAEFGYLHKAIMGADPLVRAVTLKDVYRGPGVADSQKSVTMSVTLRSDDHTLTSNEADAAMKAIVTVLEGQFNAILR